MFLKNFLGSEKHSGARLNCAGQMWSSHGFSPHRGSFWRWKWWADADATTYLTKNSQGSSLVYLVPKSFRNNKVTGH